MNGSNTEISQEMLNELFEYKDGKLLWKNSKGGAFMGNEAGGIDSTGYWKIQVNNKTYKRSRLIFLMFNGFLPPVVDHKDTNKLNDREHNLRESNNSLNTANKGKCAGSKSVYKGVRARKRGRWQAVVGNKTVGSFATEKEAAEAYNTAAKEAYGDHAVLNVI